MLPWHRIKGYYALGSRVLWCGSRRGVPPPGAAGILRISGPAERMPPLPSDRIFSGAVVDHARFFSSSAQHESGRPRMNDAITAPHVRLVLEDGHCVVTLHEALVRAKRLQLDLVEVQSKADPPVCKIMDYNKERFKQESKDKERTKKQKSIVTLRSGENKEIRFKGKTDLKDLKMKADAVLRLMERGYRVKCTVMLSGKGDEDLLGILLRFVNLIQDASVIESGPHVDPTKAYAIVRHAKFTAKKSAKKASNVLESAVKDAAAVLTESPEEAKQGDRESVKSGFSEDEIDVRFDQQKTEHVFSSESHKTRKETKDKASDAAGHAAAQQEPPVTVESNRYSRKAEPSRFPERAGGRGGGVDTRNRPPFYHQERQQQEQQRPSRWQDQMHDTRNPASRTQRSSGDDSSFAVPTPNHGFRGDAGAPLPPSGASDAPPTGYESNRYSSRPTSKPNYGRNSG